MPSTPPLSPTSSRDAARHQERSNRIMGSPENRRIPAGPSVPSTSTPSFNQQLSRVLPVDLSTRLSSIPAQDHQVGPHASTSALTLAPPPVITSMAAPAPPFHRQTLTSAQLTAAYAALPPLNPRIRCPAIRQPSSIPPQPNHPQASTSTSTIAPAPAPLTFSQLSAAYAALPPLNPQSRFIPCAVSVWHFFFNLLFLTKI